MGLDMYLYKSSEDNGVDKDFLLDDEKTLYWRGNRDLHDLFSRYGTKGSEEGYYTLDKNQMMKILHRLMMSVLNIHEASITAYYDMEDASENITEDSNLFREYYVIGRFIQKSIYNELREGDDINCINLFDDVNGKSIKKLFDNIMTFMINMKDDEHFVYLASY